MKRGSDRPPPSSPADRFQSPLQRHDTTTSSVDHEDRTKRRSAHLWSHNDNFGKDPTPDRRRQQEIEDASFEDFRPADPISRLDSSARAANASRTTDSARTSGATATTVDDFHHANSRKANLIKSPGSIGEVQPGEMLDAAENKYPDLDQQVHSGSEWQDWATPEPSQAGHTDPQTHSAAGRTDPHTQSGTGSHGHHSQASASSIQKSVGEASNDSVESYHAALQRLNAAKSNDSGGTTRSVKRWLKGQRQKTDLSLTEPERAQFTESPTWPTSPAATTPTPNHVSSFQPADEYRHLDSRSLTSREKTQREGRKSRRVSIILEDDPRSSASPNSSVHKEHKRSFFGSIGSALGSISKVSSKDQAQQLEKKRDDWERRLSSYSYVSGRSSGKDEEPFGQAAPLQYIPNKSSRRKGRTGYFSRRHRSSEGDEDAPVKGPYVGFSRRTDELETPPATPMGGGRLREPEPSPPEERGWLRARRPRLDRSSSSAYSPGDTSARAMVQPAAYNTWKKHLTPDINQSFQFTDNPTLPISSQTPQLLAQDVTPEFNEPASALNSMQTTPVTLGPTQGYLPTKSSRTPRPPAPKDPLKERNKYLWDSFYPHAADKESSRGSTKDSDRGSVVNDRWHTPFAAPKDAIISDSKDWDTGDKDWYRVRMDQVMGGDDEAKNVEDLRMLEWDLPEHLPNSPLCPLSPKHASKGKGTCVYHGRKNRKDGTATWGKYGETSPTELGIEKWI